MTYWKQEGTIKLVRQFGWVTHLIEKAVCPFHGEPGDLIDVCLQNMDSLLGTPLERKKDKADFWLIEKRPFMLLKIRHFA